MKRIEPTSRYGRTSDRNAEVPANPAAIMNGNSGRQQLEAARTLPIAPRLAATVPAPPDDYVRLLADIASLGISSPDNHFRSALDQFLARRPHQHSRATPLPKSSSRIAWCPFGRAARSLLSTMVEERRSVPSPPVTSPR